MTRILVFLALCVAVLFALRRWRNRVMHRSASSLQARTGQKTDSIKNKGRLMRDPETGTYHVESDDENKTKD